MAPAEMTAQEAAARVNQTDTLGLPLGTGQPPAFLRALGERDDWEDLRVCGALLAVGTELFTRPGRPLPVGLLRPVRARAARSRARTSASRPPTSAASRRCSSEQPPRVMATVAAPPDADGWCSLSLHAGGTVAELRRAGADPERAAGRRGVASASRARAACRPSTATRCTSTRSTCSCAARRRRSRCRARRADRRRPRDRRARAGVHPRRRDAADRHRLDPVGDRGAARRGRRRRLRRALGDVHRRPDAPAPAPARSTNRKGQFDGVSVDDVRDRHRGALQLARGQRRGRVPAGRGRQRARADRAQRDDGHDQRRAGGRHPRPGRRRHDRRRPVLGHRRRTRTSSRARACRSSQRSLLCLPSTVTGRRRADARGSCPGSTPARSSRRRATRSTSSSPSTAPPSSRARPSTSAARRWPRSPTPTSATSCSRRPSARRKGRSPRPAA